MHVLLRPSIAAIVLFKAFSLVCPMYHRWRDLPPLCYSVFVKRKQKGRRVEEAIGIDTPPVLQSTYVIAESLFAWHSAVSDRIGHRWTV